MPKNKQYSSKTKASSRNEAGLQAMQSRTSKKAASSHMTSAEDSKISIMQSFDADESVGKGLGNGE